MAQLCVVPRVFALVCCPALRRLVVRAPCAGARAQSRGPPFLQTAPSADSSFDDDYEDAPSHRDGTASPASSVSAVAEFNAEMLEIFGQPLDADAGRSAPPAPAVAAPRRSPRMSIEQARAATQALIDQQVALRDGRDAAGSGTPSQRTHMGADGGASIERGGVHVHVHYHIAGAGGGSDGVAVTTHSHVYVHVVGEAAA